MLEIEEPKNTGVNYKYEAFHVGPMRLKIVRQPHITHEQISQDNLDLNKQHIKSNSLHKLKNSSDDKCAKEKIEAIKKRPILEWIPEYFKFPSSSSQMST